MCDPDEECTELFLGDASAWERYALDGIRLGTDSYVDERNAREEYNPSVEVRLLQQQVTREHWHDM